jgi:Ca2+ transporting ATPase
LSVLAEQIGYVGMVSAALTFIAMLMHILYGAFASGNFVGSLLSLDTLLHLVDAFIISVSIIVVAVPEGLPLSVTIALAYSVGKMKQDNNLVRYLQACETMGGADNICSDKTGTLTMNRMTVTKFFLLEDTITNPDKSNFNEKVAERFSHGVCINSSANPKFNDGQIEQIGNKTDCALL